MLRKSVKLHIFVVALFIALATGVAHAQNVQQSGTITPGHTAYWVTSGVIADAGTSDDSPVTSIGATGPLCSNSARETSGAWNQFCFQAFTNSSAIISLQNYGTASPQNIVFNINGSTQGFPTVSPLPVTVGDVSCFSTAGGGITDCGFPPSGLPLIVGTTPITAGFLNGLLFNSAGKLGNITTANNGILATSGAGIPFITTALPNGITATTQALGDSTALVATTAFVQQNAQAEVPQVPIESQGGGCGVPDNTAALLAAAASVSGPVRVSFPNNCTYNFTQHDAIKFAKAVFLQGTSSEGTVLAYTPTSNGIFLNWSNGVSEISAAGGAGTNNLTINSTDTTFTKTLVAFSDVSGFNLSNTNIGWPLGGITGGTGSICLYPHGRETATITNVTLQCDKPVEIGMNPNSWLAQDHFHYENLYLIGNNPSGPITVYPLVTVDPGVLFTNTTFDGLQPWVFGNTSFSYVDTAAVNYVNAITSAGTGYVAGTPITLTGGTCSTPIQVLPLTVSGPGGILTAAIANPGVCSVTPSNPVSAVSGGAAFTLQLLSGYNLSFSNVRTEEGSTGTTYSFNMQPAAQLQNLTFRNSNLDGSHCGIFLKNTFFTTIEQSQYFYLSAGGCHIAVNATAANNNDMLNYIDDYWPVGTTQTVTAMNAIRSDVTPTGTSASVPPTAMYSSTAGGTLVLNLGITSSAVFNGSGSGATTVQASATASGTLTLPAATATLLYNGGPLGTPASGIATNLTGTASGLTAGAVAVGGITGLGTGVVGALQTNVGLANSFVVNGGVLGTPSSGVGTNLTALNASNISTGTLASARGGAGAVNGVLQGDGSGNVSQGATTGLTDATTDTAWIPTDTSGAGLTFTAVTARYTKIGKTVTAIFRLTYPSTVSGASAAIGGLPVATSPNYPASGGVTAGSCFFTGTPNAILAPLVISSNTGLTGLANNAGVLALNSVLSTQTLLCTFTYIST